MNIVVSYMSHLFSTLEITVCYRSKESVIIGQWFRETVRVVLTAKIVQRNNVFFFFFFFFFFKGDRSNC